MSSARHTSNTYPTMLPVDATFVQMRKSLAAVIQFATTVFPFVDATALPKMPKDDDDEDSSTEMAHMYIQRLYRDDDCATVPLRFLLIYVYEFDISLDAVVEDLEGSMRHVRRATLLGKELVALSYLAAKQALWVYRYVSRKRDIFAHIGFVTTQALDALIQLARPAYVAGTELPFLTISAFKEGFATYKDSHQFSFASLFPVATVTNARTRGIANESNNNTTSALYDLATAAASSELTVTTRNNTKKTKRPRADEQTESMEEKPNDNHNNHNNVVVPAPPVQSITTTSVETMEEFGSAPVLLHGMTGTDYAQLIKHMTQSGEFFREQCDVYRVMNSQLRKQVQALEQQNESLRQFSHADV